MRDAWAGEEEESGGGAAEFDGVVGGVEDVLELGDGEGGGLLAEEVGAEGEEVAEGAEGGL